MLITLVSIVWNNVTNKCLPSNLLIIKPIDHQAYWSSSLSTINHQAYQPSSQSTIEPINYWALLAIKPIIHWAYYPLSLSTIKPIDHWAYQSYCPSTIEPINLWSSFATFKPVGLFLVRSKYENSVLSLTYKNSAKSSSKSTIWRCFGSIMICRFQNCQWVSNLINICWRKSVETSMSK